MKKIFMFSFTFLLSASLFACSNKKKIELVNDAMNSLNLDFLLENRVKGGYYLNDDYDPDIDDPTKEYIDTTGFPEEVIVHVESVSDYDLIFKTSVPQIDFKTKKIIIYVFLDHNLRGYQLKNYKILGQDLLITIKKNKSGNKDTVMPYQRILYLVVDKSVSYNDVIISK